MFIIIRSCLMIQPYYFRKSFMYNSYPFPFPNPFHLRIQLSFLKFVRNALLAESGTISMVVKEFQSHHHEQYSHVHRINGSIFILNSLLLLVILLFSGFCSWYYTYEFSPDIVHYYYCLTWRIKKLYIDLIHVSKVVD